MEEPYKKILFCISYSGSKFEGFQIQKQARTVQGEFEDILSKHYKIPLRIHCAGRTDTGVHAIRQYIHCKVPLGVYKKNKVPADRLSFVLQSYLPDDIAIEYSKLVPDEFHTRYTAVSRSYCYKMYEAEVLPAPLVHTSIGVPPNIAWHRFLECAQQFVGVHDFRQFSVGTSQLHKEGKSTLREVFAVSLVREYESASFFIEGSGFLWKMVRSIVGYILSSLKQENFLEVKDLLLCESTTAQHKGIIADPQGLYLYDVKYPPQYKLPYKKIPETCV